MELCQKYVMKINKTRSFSKAAKELFVSQPSLSSTVKKLETELGFLIFDRSKNPLELTEKGRIYVEYLEDMVRSEKEMRSKIDRLEVKDKKVIRLCAPNFFSRSIMPMVCGEFYKRHPEAEIIIDMCENSGEKSWDKLATGKVDLLFRNHYNKSKFSEEEICDSFYVIVMRKDLPGAEKIAKFALTRDEILSDENLDDKVIKDYSVFKDISFIRFGQGGSVWSHMYDLMEHCKFSPCVVQNSLSFDRHYDLMLYGCGAVVTSKILIARRPEKSDELLYFLTDVNKQMMAVYRKNEPLAAHLREFIDITKEFANSNLIRW